MKVALLLSGGMDSTVLLAELLHYGHEVTCLGVHYGQRHARELVQASAVAKHMGVPFTYVSLPGLGELLPSGLTRDGGGNVVPNRNAVLVNVAVGYAVGRRLDAVAVGVNADDATEFYDCHPTFLDALGVVARANGVDLLRPFVRWSKARVAKHGVALGAPLHLSRSCYLNGEQPCGCCNACTARTAALGLAVPR